MRVTVKLFSTLRAFVPDYDPEQGVFVELTAGATVEDMLRHLGIPDGKVPLVSCNGRMLKITDPLEERCEVQIFQPISGG